MRILSHIYRKSHRKQLLPIRFSRVPVDARSSMDDNGVDAFSLRTLHILRRIPFHFPPRFVGRVDASSSHDLLCVSLPQEESLAGCSASFSRPEAAVRFSSLIPIPCPLSSTTPWDIPHSNRQNSAQFPVAGESKLLPLLFRVPRQFGHRNNVPTDDDGVTPTRRSGNRGCFWKAPFRNM